MDHYVKAYIKGTGVTVQLNSSVIATVVRRGTGGIIVRSGLGLEYFVEYKDAKTVAKWCCVDCGSATHETGSAKCGAYEDSDE